MNENFLNNMKSLHICWSCKKEHELNKKLNEYSIKCDCGGYVVTPSGKVQIKLVPTVNVYEFDDGEKHWIAAENMEIAEKFFNSEVNYDQNEYEVVEVGYEKLNDKCIVSEEGDGMRKIVSLLDCVRESESFPKYLACSVY